MTKRLIVCSAVILGLVAGCGKAYVKETEQFAAKVKSLVKPDELQAWATNLIANARSRDGESSVGVKAADIPKWVGMIYKDDGDPGRVSIEGLSNGVGTTNSCVEILFGGGFGHWGIDVGYPSLAATTTGSCYVLPWKPGIFFWSCQ